MPRVLNIGDLDYEVPRGAVYIGRKNSRWSLPESKWHNPFKPRQHTREEHDRVIAEFEGHLHETGLINDVHELRGLDLVCWCKPLPCHGDLLLRLANGR